MSLLAPLGLGLAALAIPIILLYMLKLRRKQVQVSSTFLWTRLLRDQQANAPWQKLKRNLLLFLQLLILAALVFSIARPALQTAAVASGSVIVLMDASASMNATDVSPSRFETARRTIQTLINSLGSDAEMTLILVGQAPQVLAASERNRTILRDALNQAQPAQGSADWQAAFSLAAGAAHGSTSITTVIVSDGGLPQEGLPGLPGQVTYVPIGASDDNLAITALALRPTARAPELFAEVTNFSAQDRPIVLSFYFGEELLTARQFDIPAGGRQSLTLDNLSNAAGIYKARISAPDNARLDALPLDDVAFAVYQAASARRALLVSQGNLFLEQLLASLPGIQPFRALPDEAGEIKIPADPFDLYILDGTTPASLPAGNLLFINPSDNVIFQVGEAFKEMTNPRVNEHALTQYVDWSNVHVLQATTVQTPGWAEALIETDSGPLVFAGESNGRRIAVLTFDLRESDLPLQVAYPILFSNLLNYLLPPSAFDATLALAPGESLAILPPPGVEKIIIASPSNIGYPLNPSTPNLVFTETGELGYYAANFYRGESFTVEFFAVNLFDADESNIRPRETLQVGRASISAATNNQAGQYELWPWLAALALLLLLIEWQAYHQKTWKQVKA